MVYSARSFFVTVEPLDDDNEYEEVDLERTFVTGGNIPQVYNLAVTYFSQSAPRFRIVSIQDMGPVLVAGSRPSSE